VNLEEVEKVVARLQRSLFKTANSHTVGMLKSHLKGSGLQFKEHQVYCHGDDVRFIDWKMLAKTNHPYIKTFEEERNVEIVVIIDVSPTMLFGHKGLSKLQAAIEITCLLNLLAQETSDSVTTILFHDEIVRLPTSVGRKGIIYLISELQKRNIMLEDGRYNLLLERPKGPSMKMREATVKQYMARKKEVILLSDFHDFLNRETMRSILVRRNVHPFKIVSPIDVQAKLPYSIFGKNIASVDSGAKKTGYINSMSPKQLTEEEKRYYYKILNVKNNYLEEFVRELM
jgi:uncharacterized protein (DUF58 family)